jgi:hypothetical protein
MAQRAPSGENAKRTEKTKINTEARRRGTERVVRKLLSHRSLCLRVSVLSLPSDLSRSRSVEPLRPGVGRFSALLAGEAALAAKPGGGAT